MAIIERYFPYEGNVSPSAYNDLVTGVTSFPTGVIRDNFNGTEAFIDFEGVALRVDAFYSLGVAANYFLEVNAQTLGDIQLVTLGPGSLNDYVPTPYGGMNRILMVLHSSQETLRVFSGRDYHCHKTYACTPMPNADIQPGGAGLSLGNHYTVPVPSDMDDWGYESPANNSVSKTLITVNNRFSLPCADDLDENAIYYMTQHNHGVCNISPGEFIIIPNAGGGNTVHKIQGTSLSAHLQVVGTHPILFQQYSGTLNQGSFDGAHHEIWWPGADNYTDDDRLFIVDDAGFAELLPGSAGSGGTTVCLITRWVHANPPHAVYHNTYDSLLCKAVSMSPAIRRVQLADDLPICWGPGTPIFVYTAANDLMLGPNYSGMGGDTPPILRSLVGPAGWGWSDGDGDAQVLNMRDENDDLVDRLYVTSPNRNFLQVDVFTNTLKLSSSGNLDPDTCVATVTSTTYVWNEWLGYCPYLMPKYPLVEGEPCGVPVDNSVYWVTSGSTTVTIWVPRTIPGSTIGNSYARYSFTYGPNDPALPYNSYDNHPVCPALEHFQQEDEIYIDVIDNLDHYPDRPNTRTGSPEGTLFISLRPQYQAITVRALWYVHNSLSMYWAQNNSTSARPHLGDAAECAGHWSCPGNGQPAEWIGDLPTVGNPPDCTGSYSCPGNGSAPTWSNPLVAPYGAIPDCTGSYSCPGNGQPAEWNGTVPPYGAIPDCTGSYSCPGNAAAAIWSNVAIAPYGSVPVCVGEWSCPGNGVAAVWSNSEVDPYGDEPSCVGEYTCPDDGSAAVWSNSEVGPYGDEPDCSSIESYDLIGLSVAPPCVDITPSSTSVAYKEYKDPELSVRYNTRLWDTSLDWNIITTTDYGDINYLLIAHKNSSSRPVALELLAYIEDNADTLPMVDGQLDAIILVGVVGDTIPEFYIHDGDVVNIVNITPELTEEDFVLGKLFALDECLFVESTGGIGEGDDFFNGTPTDPLLNIEHTPTFTREDICRVIMARHYDKLTELDLVKLTLAIESGVFPKISVEYSDDSTDGVDGVWVNVANGDGEDDMPIVLTVESD